MTAVDLFKQEFKYFKSRSPKPDFSRVIDFSKSELISDEFIEFSPNSKDTKCEKYGLLPPEKWRVFTRNDRKGLIFIRNPFTGAGHRYWAIRCLRDFSKKPHKLNIDAHGDLSNGADWWEASHSKNAEHNKVLQKKLRWTTLGYHHDWDTKHYTEESRNEFPSDLSEMCEIIAKQVGFDGFKAQASIVNYYHMDSTLAAHTDHSEKNLEAPLISISFGQSAIFLIGGETKETKPLAMYLRSGDILIMSKESRLCYHAVPRIVQATNEPWEFKNINTERKADEEREDNLFIEVFDEVFWKPFGDYMRDSRININVRQVLYKNQKTLEDVS